MSWFSGFVFHVYSLTAVLALSAYWAEMVQGEYITLARRTLLPQLRGALTGQDADAAWPWMWEYEFWFQVSFSVSSAGYEPQPLAQGPEACFLDRCEVCDLPFRTRREFEDRIDMGFTSGELDLWARGRFRFEIPQSSLALHKDHVFLAELYPSMSLKRPEPLTVEERKAHVDSVFPLEVREAIYRMQHTREDDTQV